MRFENHTPLPADVVRTAERDDRVTCLVVCAMSCAIGRRGLSLLAEQRPLLTDPGLPFPNDVMPVPERGVSVTATGFVHPARPGDRSAFARLAVGDRELSLVAFGRRVWQRSAGSGRLEPSSPEPLEPVEMDWKNAYGGTLRRKTALFELDGEPTILPEHDASYPHNPDGAGFYLSEEEAELSPLPQIELAESPCRAFGDHPEPGCFAPYPLYGGLRGEFVVREGAIDKSRLGRLTSRAVPRLTFDVLPPGTRLGLAGMRPGGETLAFSVPESPAALSLGVGVERAMLPLALDAVDIDAEHASVRFVFRLMVSYALVRHERRVASLLPSDGLSKLPAAR